MKKNFSNIIICTLTLLSIIYLFLFNKYRISSTVIISEVNTSLDYVELYNSSDLTINLNNYALSDSKKLFGKQVIKNISIEPNEYRVIYLEDFSISKLETVYLLDNKGYVIDELLIPENENDAFSYGYIRSQNIYDYFYHSPGKENHLFNKDKPKFSSESGFYDEEFYLTIEGTGKIYYTVDGSEPSSNSLEYTSPIHIYNRSNENNILNNVINTSREWSYDNNAIVDKVDKAFVVRAISVVDDSYSEVVTGVYFVDLDKYLDTNVLSIVADKNDLFGDNGIYVTGKEYDDWYINKSTDIEPNTNYNIRGIQSEIEADLFYYSNILSFSQTVGFRIRGNKTRNDILKPFSVFAREYYNEDYYFNKNITRLKNIHSYSIDNDFIDLLVMDLVKDRNVATLDGEPISVFINGDYWFNGTLFEKYDKNYFYEKYSINPDTLYLIKGQEIISGDYDNLYDVYTFVNNNDMSLDVNYNYFINEIDVSSYIDLIITNIYINNLDFNEYGNIITYKDGKTGLWKYGLYDLDMSLYIDPFSYNVSTPSMINSFAVQPPNIKITPINGQLLFSNLKKNDDFCNQFIISFLDILNYNFNYERVMDRLNYYYAIDNTINYDYFDEFYKDRSIYMIKYLKEEFDLTNNKTNTINIIDPRILNFNSLVLNGSFSGKYIEGNELHMEIDESLRNDFIGYEVDGILITNDYSLDLIIDNDITISLKWKTE